MSTDTTTTTTTTTPVWDPIAQIYVGGVVPGASNQDVQDLLQANEGFLRVFGYGSLCWNPGNDGALGHTSVKSMAGHAKGYRRVWAQKSTDHRGHPAFPGIVCTLLSQEEVQSIIGVGVDSSSASTDNNNHPQLTMMTEGMIYVVPPALAQECLAELDFREKGGYAREIVTVVEDDSGTEVQALLYRGTPNNPAFWPLAVQDKPLAAAVMAVSVGPSGPNDVYLNQLDEFLQQHTSTSEDLEDDTCTLAAMVHELQQQKSLYFLYGCGSNQHSQLRQHTLEKPPDQDIPQLVESVICTPAKKEKGADVDPPKQLLAGGGHSGLITQSGNLYLWGWNEQGQCGSSTTTTNDLDNHPTCPLPVRQPIPNLLIQQASLGFSHTLAIEKDTGKLFAWGDNTHGQCDSSQQQSSITEPTLIFPSDQFVAVAAGVFHSAAITTKGELVTWGSGKQGQCIASDNNSRWTPPDGSKLVQVVSGRHHSAVVDNKGRFWTMGDNKYGQLGRNIDEATTNGHSHQQGKPTKRDPVPTLVDGPLGKEHDGSLKVDQLESGWSHLVARVVEESTTNNAPSMIYGWGRSDKGQLGTAEKSVHVPKRIETPTAIRQIACGSESTYFLADDDGSSIYSCGWNEHGNLGIIIQDDAKQEEDVTSITPLVGTARIVSPPTYRSNDNNNQLLMAAEGAHFLVMKA